MLSEKDMTYAGADNYQRYIKGMALRIGADFGPFPRWALPIATDRTPRCGFCGRFDGCPRWALPIARGEAPFQG